MRGPQPADLGLHLRRYLDNALTRDHGWFVHPTLTEVDRPEAEQIVDQGPAGRGRRVGDRDVASNAAAAGPIGGRWRFEPTAPCRRRGPLRARPGGL